jgi:hypothetical protein
MSLAPQFTKWMGTMLARPGRMTFALALLVTLSPAAAQEVPLHGQTKLHFASLEEGQAALGKTDAYVRAQSRYDRQSRMATEDDVSEEQFLRFAAAAVEAWPEEEIQTLTAAASSIQKRLAPYRLPFPPTVLLIRTSGKEEGNAAYCRANAVILPGRLVTKHEAKDLERLLLHELFHVLSSHNPELRKALYAIIGFKPAPGIEFPASLRDRKITNPDASTIEYRIDLTIDGQAKSAAPILYTSLDKYRAGAGGTFFQHMLFKLMIVEEAEGKWRPVEVNGKAIVVDPKKLPSFQEQIGGNTTYIIHPDEILADNFVHLALENDKVPTPRILTEMKKVLGVSEPKP